MSGAASAPFFVRLGGWLFPRRTWIPFPLIAALLLIPAGARGAIWVAAGGVTVVAGEWLRLRAVRQIGVISRTRSERLGPLIDSGPFAWVRNPLYLGNIAVWIGFTLIARLPWLAPIFLALLLFEYHAIVSWEERLLASRLGPAYVDYTRRVPRWLPRPPAHAAAAEKNASFSWGDTLFSEGGTLIAILLGCALLWIKGAAW